jgi:hypothetical protein
MAGSVRPTQLERADAPRLAADLGLRLGAASQLSWSNVSCCSKLTLAASVFGGQVHFGSRFDAVDRPSVRL